jgi:type I restriction enzyme R subunit
LHGFDYSKFQHGTELEKAQIIKGGVNFLSDITRAEKRKEFVKNAALLKQSVTLCASLLNESLRFEAAYMETLCTLLNRLSAKGGISKKEINERISLLLQQSVHSEGVVNLFEEQTEFSLFDEKFMNEVRKMKERNIAAELLAKLLKGQVRNYQRTNVVQGDQFSSMLENTLSRYLQGLITNEEVIQELLKLAQEIAQAENDGQKLGLNKEEKAFYDALTRPELVRSMFSDEEFVQITKELTETLRRSRTVDWTRREAARADMRRMVRRLLAKYKYPPKEAMEALDIVMRQCEQWADNNDYDETTSSYTIPMPTFNIAAEK